MAANKFLYLKPIQVSSLPCIHVTEPTVFPKRYASAQQLTICTETLAVTRLSAFTEQCDRLNPVICDWESFPPYCKRLLQDNMEKSSSFLANEDQLAQLLLGRIMRWAAANNFTMRKASTLIDIFYRTHRYFCSYPWQNQAQTYYFFKECVLLNSVQHLPNSKRIFDPTECRSVLLVFCHIYLAMLPIIRQLSLPNFRLHVKECEDTEGTNK